MRLESADEEGEEGEEEEQNGDGYGPEDDDEGED